MAAQKNLKKLGLGLGDDIYLDPGEELKKKGVYYITGSIEEDGLLDIQQDILLKHLDPEWKSDIQLIINSTGGSVAETWALIDLMDSVKMDIKTIGMGDCMSAGASLLAAGTKGKRFVAKNCTIMIHGMSTSLNYGNKFQLVSQMKWVLQEQERDIKFWIDHSKYNTVKQVEKYLLDGLDKFMTPQIAMKHGIIDAIQGKEEEEE